MFNKLWKKIKKNTLVIDHFIIKYKLDGVVTRRSRCWVLCRSTTSLFFNVTLYTLVLCWLGTQKSNTNLNNGFYTSFRFDKLLSEIDNVLQKGEFKLNHVSILLKELNFPSIHATSPKTLFNNVTQWLTKMLIGFKHFSPLCLRIWCHEKHLYIFNLS